MAKANLLTLRPTQFALGMIEVEAKVTKLRKFSSSELKDYLGKHAVPVVLGPKKETYLIDHHHLVRASWELGYEAVFTEVKEDFSQLSVEKFWIEMEKGNWVYLHDQFGKGPHLPDFLPFDVRGLADDPFRSLSWALRERGGYEKCTEPFCEFRWAEFLRKNISGHPVKMGFEKAIELSMKLSRSPEAKHLPGYKKS